MYHSTQTRSSLCGQIFANVTRAMSSIVLGLLFSLSATRAFAQVACVNCPANGQAAGVAAGIFVTRTNGSIVLPGNPIGACEQLIVHTDLGYKAAFPGGVVGAGYYGGTANVLAFSGASLVSESTANVTPAILASTKIGPVAPAPNACGDTDDLALNNLTYTPTAADIAAGSVRFRLEYTGGTTLIVPCNLQASGSVEFTVQIAALPTCSIVPTTTNVCVGGSATFTASATGTGPLSYCWRKGCPGAGACLSTGTTLTITNAQLSDSSCYQLTVTDSFGCTSTCQATLVVNPPPSCSITPAAATNCVGSSTSFTVQINSGTAPYTVVLSGCISETATVQAQNGSLIRSHSCASPGTCTLTANVTDSRGCVGQPCTATHTCVPNPTCNVTGPSDVCEFTTNTYSSTVDPAGGTVTHSWSFVGAHPNAFFVGSTTGSSVQVGVGAAVTSRDCFSLTDAVTRDGCVSSCTNTFCLVPCRPAIKVYKQVVCYSNVCEPFSSVLTSQHTAQGVSSGTNCPAFCYRITVTNVGNITLTNVTVVDDSNPNPDLNLSLCFPGPFTLAPGATTNCVVTDVMHCQNTMNVVTATGTGFAGNQSTNVTSRDTNSVTVVPISVICQFQILTNGTVVPGACPSFSLSTPYTVRLMVMNNGQYPLQNVTVSNVAGLCFGSSTNIGSLAVNETKSIDCNNQCTVQSSNYFAASVLASASDSQGHICAFNTAGQLIRATTSCSACVTCTGRPRICVTKEVVCELPNGCTNNWSHFATSAKTADNSQCPTFCYRVRVTNCGEEVLNSVSVVDNVISLTGCNFPTTLAVGQTAECIVSGVDHCRSVTNTVTASGVGASSGIGVSTNDTAAVVVLPISITCNITVNGKPHESIPCDGQGHLITNAVQVCNTGSLPLSDITINAPEIVALGCTNVANLRLALLPGQCTNVLLCIDMVTCPPSCGLAFSNYIRITATVDQTLTNVCSWTANPSNQVVAVTASTECVATVECIPPPKTGCTPGFWKNCTIHWQPTGYRIDQSVSSVFSLGSCCTSLGNSSLLGALGFGGGSGVCGGAQILLRAAVGALLNASSPELDYPFTQQEVISLVNAALQSCDRGVIIALASELDRDNNLGCRGANGESLPCHRLSNFPRVAPDRVLDSPRVAPTR